MKIRRLYYSSRDIEELKVRLAEQALKDSTPKKYGIPMFQAYEVICQLREEAVRAGVKLQAYEDAVADGELGLVPQHKSSDISPAVAAPAKEKSI